ncbi:ABC transporter permease [Roseiterribacter gracilis]|uniref:Transport permease protein n=1 Tax=Roseiterribacter gracilis TaxID=2812848 RepID=A0A8S8XBB8_9PROT|nr:transport permease protein [Rhodospirillales bacterium TMPK1]
MQQQQQRDSTTPLPREMGAINWIGFATLFSKEVRRFAKVYMQTVAAPVVTTLLFFAVFALALGGAGRSVGDVPFLEFLAPGLIIMTMAQNAFQNTSSSIMIAKNQGTIVDVLMPPMTSGELAVGYVAAAVLRGLVVGLVTIAVVALFVRIHLAHPLLIALYGLLGTMMLGLLGIAGAIWAEKFDHIAAVTNFIVTPLTFLSGTFYPIERLPENWRFVAHLNPFFYMIDGFRHGFIGGNDSFIGTGIAVLVAVNAGLWLLVLRMLSTGYKLKS